MRIPSSEEYAVRIAQQSQAVLLECSHCYHSSDSYNEIQLPELQRLINNALGHGHFKDGMLDLLSIAHLVILLKEGYVPDPTLPRKY